MKNRNIPFGYKYENGMPVIHEAEKETVIAIFTAYLGGKSLQEIADHLTINKVAYSPGVTVWNKSRIMRILEDERYLGQCGFPKIIDAKTRDAMLTLKESKNMQTTTDRSTGIYQLHIPCICYACGHTMRRITDSRNNYRQRWVCSDTNCRICIKMPDDTLMGEITARMNAVIGHPEILSAPSVTPREASTEQRRLDNEIARTLEEISYDRDALLEKMLQRVSLQYGTLDSGNYETERLRSIFANTPPLTEFSPELVNHTIRQILFKADGSVSILLDNDQEISKEMIHHDANRLASGTD